MNYWKCIFVGIGVGTEAGLFYVCPNGFILAGLIATICVFLCVFVNYIKKL